MTCTNCQDWHARLRHNFCEACELAVLNAVEATLERRRAFARMLREVGA